MSTDSGIKVEMVVGEPGECPAAAASEACGATVSDVAQGTVDGETVTEFTLPADVPDPDREAEPVFSADSSTRYRHRGDRLGPCACEFVEERACPVSDRRACDGRLHLTFYAPDVGTVREIVGEARESFGDVGLSHLSQSGDLPECDPVVVDRGQLTERQREVLETAFELGYFEHPKEANAGDVADELGIATSTFSEHLAAAQRKLAAALVE